jgi:hypothetical protein
LKEKKKKRKKKDDTDSICSAALAVAFGKRKHDISTVFYNMLYVYFLLLYGWLRSRISPRFLTDPSA